MKTEPNVRKNVVLSYGVIDIKLQAFKIYFKHVTCQFISAPLEVLSPDLTSCECKLLKLRQSWAGERERLQVKLSSVLSRQNVENTYLTKEELTL